MFTMLNKESGSVETKFNYSQCSSMESSELWLGEHSNKLLVIHTTSYYDDNLKERRATNNMLSPWKPSERLILLGQVWGGDVKVEKELALLSKFTIKAVVHGT